MSTKIFFFLFLAGGKINRPGQLAPRGENNQGGGQGGGGKISWDILPPGGQAVQGGGQDKLLHRFQSKNLRINFTAFINDFLIFFSRTVTSCINKKSLKISKDSKSFRAFQILYLNCLLKAEFL